MLAAAGVGASNPSCKRIRPFCKDRVMAACRIGPVSQTATERANIRYVDKGLSRDSRRQVAGSGPSLTYRRAPGLQGSSVLAESGLQGYAGRILQGRLFPVTAPLNSGGVCR